MACLWKSNKKWLCYGRSKVGDVLASRSIGRDADDAGHSVSCSLAIITSSDFDCVHEVFSKSLANRLKNKRISQLQQGPRTASFFLKSSTNTFPHSKRQSFDIQHAFPTKFSQAPP